MLLTDFKTVKKKLVCLIRLCLCGVSPPSPQPYRMMLFSLFIAGPGSVNDTSLRNRFTSQDDKGLITQGSTQNG